MHGCNIFVIWRVRRRCFLCLTFFEVFFKNISDVQVNKILNFINIFLKVKVLWVFCLVRRCAWAAWKYFERFNEIAPVICYCAINFWGNSKFLVHTVYSCSNNIVSVRSYHTSNRQTSTTSLSITFDPVDSHTKKTSSAGRPHVCGGWNLLETGFFKRNNQISFWVWVFSLKSPSKKISFFSN